MGKEKFTETEIKNCIHKLPYGDFELWDSNPFELYNNCCSYAHQDINFNTSQKPQPGDKSGLYGGCFNNFKFF